MVVHSLTTINQTPETKLRNDIPSQCNQEWTLQQASIRATVKKGQRKPHLQKKLRAWLVLLNDSSLLL